MTLTICIMGKDGVVLGSDSRATVGDPRGQTAINEPVKKIFPIGKHAGLGIAGEGGLGLSIIDDFQKEFSHCGEMSISEIVERLRLKCTVLYGKWFPHLTPEDRPGLSLIVAGYTASASSKSEIYALHSYYNFAPIKSTMGFEAIGLPRLAHYLLNNLYRPEIDVKQAAMLTAFCIEETSSQDAKVGADTQIATFSDSKGYFDYTKTELDTLKQECSEFREKMKEQIYGSAIQEPKTGHSPKTGLTKLMNSSRKQSQRRISKRRPPRK